MHANVRENNQLKGGVSRWAAARLLGFVLAGALIAGAQSAAAQVLVFDRGLPTTNLNNASGANQSNVVWADQETLPITPYLPGDDFTLPGTSSYIVSTIRVWSTDNTGLTLRGGVADGTIGALSSTFTATPVTYTNSQSYQTGAGAFLQLYQIDFTVSIPLNGGVNYQFFLGGPAVQAGADFRGARLHASNAALSGSTQQGANGTFLFLANDGTAQTWNSQTGTGTYCTPTPCPGWDKVSDGNVQVFATTRQAAAAVQVPTMSGLGLAGLALLLAAAGHFVTRRRPSV